MAESKKRTRTNKITRIRKKKKSEKKGVDTFKYCGVITLDEDPLAIQKRLRDEWR